MKQSAFNARWQIRQLKQTRANVILFVDEPYLSSFGSAFISLSREQVISLLNEVFDAIHAEGALAGVHCCGNTDWSVLLETSVDILNLDAYGYLEKPGLVSRRSARVSRSGRQRGLGHHPNNEESSTSAGSLAQRLRERPAIDRREGARARYCDRAGGIRLSQPHHHRLRPGADDD